MSDYILSVSVRSRWDVKDFETTEVPTIEFIGYRIPQHKQNNYTMLFTRCVGKFWYLKYFSCGVNLRNTSRLFFSYSNFRCGYLDNQSEYPKSLKHFCLLILCEWLCAFVLLVLRYPIPNKFTRANLGRFNSYRLLTLTKRKNRLRWLKAVSSTFQDVDFDVSLLPLVITWCYYHGIKKLPSCRLTRWYQFCDTIGYHSNTKTCWKHP